MELQLKKIIAFILSIGLLACSKGGDIEGNWGAVDEMNNYSELYIQSKNIRIYSDIGGLISPLTFFVQKDSLFTNILNYKITRVNSDSLLLESGHTILYLRRIDKGFKLSDYTNEDFEDKFQSSFYSRLYERKGLKQNTELSQDSISHSLKEEIIEIKR